MSHINIYLIFNIDDIYVNQYGQEVPAKDSYTANYYDDDDDLTYNIEEFHRCNAGIDKVLIPESTTELEWEIDDVFGNFGFSLTFSYVLLISQLVTH